MTEDKKPAWRDPELLAGRRRRMGRLEQLAAGQAGVVSRSQAYGLGVTRHEVEAQLRARRWQVVGSQSLVTHTGPLTDEAAGWAAVFEAGPRAFLDGASALKAAGLKKFEVDRVRVSVPRGARVRRVKGVDVKQTRRWCPADLASGAGPPRARSHVAAIRGALWARSDKQAALLMTMTVQQGLATPEQLGQELLRVRRDRRRPFLHALVLDLLAGARSLGEVDVARECRARGLPEPTRQSVRRGPRGTYFLDIDWEEWGVVVEVDGIQHAWAQNLVSDALRHNDLTLQGSTVLRLPLLGLRVAPDDFFRQIESALTAAGWTPHNNVIRSAGQDRHSV